MYLNLRTLSERGVLPSRHSDIYATFTAAMIDPLPEKQRQFLAVMGLADEFTVEMAQYITGDADAGQILSRPAGWAGLSLPPYDESVRRAELSDDGAGNAAAVLAALRQLV